MEAYNNDPRFKEQLIKRAQEHRIADQYIKDYYYQKDNTTFRGCSVGCCIRDVNDIQGTKGQYDNHAFLAAQLGIPEVFIHLQDIIFERLPDPKHKEWTERFLNAIQPGADLTPVIPKMLLMTRQYTLEAWKDVFIQECRPCPIVEFLEKWIETGTLNSRAIPPLRQQASPEHLDGVWIAAISAYSTKLERFNDTGNSGWILSNPFSEALLHIADAEITKANRPVQAVAKALENMTDSLIKLIEECA